MRAAAVVGSGVRPDAAALAGLARVSPAELASDPDRYERVLVLGTTADVAAAAAAAPRAVIAFGGAIELTALFAIDPSSAAARARLDAGTEYPADLGYLRQGTHSRPFLGSVGAGAGARWVSAFPWAHRPGSVTVTSGRTISTRSARAVVVSNTQRHGVWTVAPRAAINDSRIEVQVFSGSLAGLLRLRPALRHGLHERTAGVQRLIGTACEVTVPASWRVVCDGRPAGRGPFDISLAAGAVTLLV